MNLVWIVLILIPLVYGDGYVSLLKQLDRQKCTLNQYSLLIYGNEQSYERIDCGLSGTQENGYYEGTKNMYATGTFVRSGTCIWLLVYHVEKCLFIQKVVYCGMLNR